ncbi:MAG: formate/nitrite transporter family protein, partial [Chloroflexi bacterium]|nr:formate/nitrite transporter family protein [Chloroflexota bacterium]
MRRGEGISDSKRAADAVKGARGPFGSGADVESGKHQDPSEVFEPLVREGAGQLQRSSWDLALSGLIAGLDIGFGPLAMAIVAGRLHALFHLSVMQALFFGGFLYPLGFVFVIMGKSELFTENTLAPVAGLLTGSSTITLLARSWALILGLNTAGTIIFSLFVAHVDLLFVPYKDVYRTMGMALVGQDFLQATLAGVFGGWLVALIAWLVESTKGSIVHFVIIYVVAYLLVGLTLYHSVIGSIEV